MLQIGTGFFVMFRMPGETVLNKEYAFNVSPGKEILVELDTVQVREMYDKNNTIHD